MKVDNVTFGAKYVKSANILKKEQNKLVKHKLAMVELDPYDINDINTANNLSIEWGGYRGIPHAYANNMKNIFLKSQGKVNQFL